MKCLDDSVTVSSLLSCLKEKKASTACLCVHSQHTNQITFTNFAMSGMQLEATLTL